jgi:hypothetical protein
MKQAKAAAAKKQQSLPKQKPKRIKPKPTGAGLLSGSALDDLTDDFDHFALGSASRVLGRIGASVSELDESVAAEAAADRAVFEEFLSLPVAGGASTVPLSVKKQKRIEKAHAMLIAGALACIPARSHLRVCIQPAIRFRANLFPAPRLRTRATALATRLARFSRAKAETS